MYAMNTPAPENHAGRRRVNHINGEAVALLLLVSLVTFLYLLPLSLPGERRDGKS